MSSVPSPRSPKSPLRGSDSLSDLVPYEEAAEQQAREQSIPTFTSFVDAASEVGDQLLQCWLCFLSALELPAIARALETSDSADSDEESPVETLPDGRVWALSRCLLLLARLLAASAPADQRILCQCAAAHVLELLLLGTEAYGIRVARVVMPLSAALLCGAAAMPRRHMLQSETSAPSVSRAPPDSPLHVQARKSE